MIEFERSRCLGGGDWASYFEFVINRSFLVNVHGIGEDVSVSF